MVSTKQACSSFVLLKAWLGNQSLWSCSASVFLYCSLLVCILLVSFISDQYCGERWSFQVGFMQRLSKDDFIIALQVRNLERHLRAQ